MSIQDPVLERAIGAVSAACRVARHVQHEGDAVRHLTKDDRSPVTVADFAVQAAVAMTLLDDDPDVLIVGEESAELLRADEGEAIRRAVVAAVHQIRPDAGDTEVVTAIDRCDHDARADVYWTLDPVDGTKGFLRGQQYAIALARIEAGEVTLGVLGCPNLPTCAGGDFSVADPTGAVYAATRGGGARRVDQAAPERLEAPTWAPPRPIRVCESVEKAHSKQSATARILEHLGQEPEAVRLDSQCKYAVVARGTADAYLRLPTKAGYVEKIWDHAAGSLVATEAGAIVTDASGNPLDFRHGPRLEQNRGVVCASASIHAPIIEAIASLDLGLDLRPTAARE